MNIINNQLIHNGKVIFNIIPSHYDRTIRVFEIDTDDFIIIIDGDCPDLIKTNLVFTQVILADS